MRASRRVMICSVMVPLLVGAALLWTHQAHTAQGVQSSTQAASCRNSRVSWPAGAGGERKLRLEVDVDGDGRTDVLEAESGCGSGSCGTDVQLTLGESGTRLEAREEFSFTAITAINPVPKELLNPRYRDALAWIEEALFDRICTSPEPSLAWLLDPKKRLRWIEGPPQIPRHYAIRLAAKSLPGLLRVASAPVASGGKIDLDGEVWLLYAGGVHAYKEPVEMARTGDRVLLGTAHGVILTNPKRSRHAWIYVSEGCDKLRSPCIAGARLQGDTAIITLNRSLDPDGLPDLPDAHKGSKPLQVRINLKTGAILK